jgi:hypothetical protein
MARNLQSKLPASDTLRIYDINSKILDQFVSESKSGAAVQVAETVRDAAENSVRLSTLFPTLYHPTPRQLSIANWQLPSPAHSN